MTAGDINYRDAVARAKGRDDRPSPKWSKRYWAIGVRITFFDSTDNIFLFTVQKFNAYMSDRLIKDWATNRCGSTPGLHDKTVKNVWVLFKIPLLKGARQ